LISYRNFTFNSDFNSSLSDIGNNAYPTTDFSFIQQFNCSALFNYITNFYDQTTIWGANNLKIGKNIQIKNYMDC
jgi:hypothetical protein